MNLVPLFEEALEFQDYNGTVLSDGKVAVYYIGRTRLADIYEDVAAEYPAENPRILNNLGMGPVYVNPAFDYEMVVFDAYGSELFSVKKYLASKGEHSTANVVVTPSESIAVSAWTVGDVQVYMPYLTGQLGKVYEGIDPIVVNNQVDKISANHVPLGVQDPLYFVQDDEEACIIGFSGEALPEGTMNESAFGYQDGQITSYNGSAFSAGNSYEAGSYVDITNNTISITGLSPVPADTASTGLVASVSADITAMIPDTSDMATQTWVNEQGFLTAHQDISNKLDTTAFSTVSGDFITAIPSEYVTENTLQSGLSSKLDSTAFSTVSANFLTAHQSLDGLMSASLLEQSGGLITGYNGTAFAGQGGGGVTGDYELSAGSGISIEDFPLEQKTVISVTAQGGNPEVEQAVIDNSATWDSVTSKADVTAIPSTAGLATEDWVTGQGYITNDAITSKQDITGMTAYQPAGDYLTTADSANFYTTANESGFVTSGELPDPITIGVQEGDTLDTDYDGLKIVKATANGNEHINLHKKSTDQWLIHGNLVPTSPGSNKYLVTDDSGAMHWDNKSALAYDSAFEQSGGYITAYNGSAFKAGDEFPQSATDAIGYVTATSANIDSTIDNVSANSGAWGGSAIPVSAGEGVKVDYTNGMLVFKQDRTLLYSGNTRVSQWTASEPLTNFEKIEFTIAPETNQECATTILYPMVGINTGAVRLAWAGTFGGWRDILWQYKYNTNDMMAFTGISGNYWGINDAGNTGQGSWNAGSLTVYTVYGLNRKV